MWPINVVWQIQRRVLPNRTPGTSYNATSSPYVSYLIDIDFNAVICQTDIFVGSWRDVVCDVKRAGVVFVIIISILTEYGWRDWLFGFMVLVLEWLQIMETIIAVWWVESATHVIANTVTWCIQCIKSCTDSTSSIAQAEDIFVYHSWLEIKERMTACCTCLAQG